MTDNELLLAISDIMDKKLEPIKQDISEIKLRLDRVEERLDRVEERLDRVEERLDRVEERLERVEERLDRVEERLERVEERLDQVEERLDQVEREVQTIKLTLENDFKPRLQNIEGCYLTTYRRYQSGVDQIETMQSDIDVMKRVMIEHSEKLRKWA